MNHEDVTASPTNSSTTHFGDREVDVAEKARLVGEVFRSVAGRYDLMNDLMSFGAHRMWRRFAATQSGLHCGDAALDVAAGSGDMAMLLARQVGAHGAVTVSDVNPTMLAHGRDKLTDAGWLGNIQYALCDAENLCFADEAFDCTTIAFGLRNVTRIDAALATMHRVTRVGGRLLVLEFSKPIVPLLNRLYDRFSFALIPALGKLIADDEASYRYLVESIRKHPDQNTLRTMMLRAGFDEVRVHNLTGGIVALHIGVKG